MDMDDEGFRERLLAEITDWRRRKATVGAPPPPRLARYDCVRILEYLHDPSAVGRNGVVVWSDDHWFYRSRPDPEWLHLIELSEPLADGCAYLCSFESALAGPLGRSDPGNHVARRDEVSFDTEEGREGCVRRRGAFWEPFFVVTREIEAPAYSLRTAESGMPVHHLELPEGHPFSQEETIALLSGFLELVDPVVVRAFDSLVLR
jgi:hypothetical protein